MKEFLKNFELIVGSIFLSVTVVVVIMNVFTRYVLQFTYFWTEEVAVGCFVWTIFLGTAAAYREKALIGVEALIILLPKKVQNGVAFITQLLLLLLSSLMFYFSLTYVMSSTKITAALELSYSYINVAIVISFALMTLYSVLFALESFRAIFLDKNKERGVL